MKVQVYLNILGNYISIFRRNSWKDDNTEKTLDFSIVTNHLRTYKHNVKTMYNSQTQYKMLYRFIRVHTGQCGPIFVGRAEQVK